MPLTTSGKINRKALPEVDLESIETLAEYIAPETDKEKILADCISEVLGAEKISVADNFFDIGGDSLKAIELSARLEAEGYEIRVKDIFESGNIRELAEKLEENTREYVKAEYGNVFPATAAQMRVYTAQMLKPESTLYNITYAFRAENTDKQRLEAAVNGLISRHESLRTRFENRQGTICQIIDSTAYVSVEEAESINSFARPFELDKSPLIRVGCNEESIVIDMHHIVVDGESMPVFFRELNELYMGRDIKDDAVQYGEFAVTDGYTKENESYWLDVFSTQAPSLELPCDRQRPAEQSFDGAVYYGQIDIGLHGKIEEKCKEAGITPYVYYMACLSVLLSKLSGSEDIVIGTPISGRQSRFLDAVGMFVNTIALRSRPDGNKTISELLNEIREGSIEAIDNQNYPFGELVKKLGIEQSGRNPLFDIMLAYQSFELTDITFADKKAELIPLEISAAKCDITFNILPRRNDVVLAAEYCTDLFKEEKIRSFTEMYISLLEKCLDGERYIRDVSVLGEEEREKVLVSFNDTTVPYDKETCVYRLFEEQVRANSDKKALVFKNISLTYSQLRMQVEDYAGKLVAFGIRAGETVAVHLERSHKLVILQLAVLKIGAVFLPIDKRYPEDRIRCACDDCNVRLLISDEKVNVGTKAIAIDEFEEICAEKAQTVTNKDSCYIIYTSGSTGRPKGCLLNGRGLLNFCKNNNTLETLNNIADCTFACVNAVSFDYFIAESLLPLTNGFTTVVLDDAESTIQNRFLSVVTEHKINVLMTTPTRLKIYFNSDSVAALSQLRCICTSGEPLTAELLSQMYEKSPEAKVYNPIGPSECSVWDMGGELNREDGIDIHIGKPIANAQIYITDRYINPVPIGVTGEICIAGDGVGDGYINNSVLTAERFIDNPFGEGKLYRTGDLGCWREDGNIVFVGRNDFQVKVRGLRIELGEIENAVSEVEGIALSVAVVREDNQGRQFICAFYSGKEVESKLIKAQLSEKLPKYMIPNIFVRLEEMPLTTSGKINRKALPEVVYNIKDDVQPPENNTEKFICKEFRRILGIDAVGRNSDFFELGGTSLSMIELLSEEPFEKVSAAEFMQNATPSELALLMDGKSSAEFSYLEPLYVSDDARKSLILLPYGGGGAEAYVAFVNEFKKLHNDVAVYFIRFLHSDAECENAASEIEKRLSGTEVTVCSHCAGTAIALKILEKLERDGFEVKSYYASAFIPTAVRSEKNSWRNTPDFVIRRLLNNSGAKLVEVSKDIRKSIMMRFRADTDYATEVFYKYDGRISTPVTVIISKDDYFTREYDNAYENWSVYAENVIAVDFIDSQSHYFQSDNASEFVKMIKV